jgi:hypothetical protein
MMAEAMAGWRRTNAMAHLVEADARLVGQRRQGVELALVLQQ